MAELTLSQLTEAKVDGNGVFDTLMRAAKDHLDLEFRKNAIKGPEYAQVYLGQLQSILETSVSFLLQREKVNLEAQLLELQVQIAGVELEKARVALQLGEQELLTVVVQRELVQAQVKLAEQQVLNAEVENRVLEGQVCKLQAEFDLTKQSTLKGAAETTLLIQKLATEKAQVLGLGVDADSVIGRQKALYVAQTDGFKRDAEQKAAKLYIDVWSARRMTDEGTEANATNGLDEVTTGKVMEKLRQGVGVAA